MKILTRQLQLLGVCAVVMAMGLDFANAVRGDTEPVVVGLAKCADCTRKNMNAEAAFSGLQVAVKCKNSKGEYENKAVGHVDRSGAFRVPLATDLVGDDGNLKQECFAQLHSASTSAPCSGQEPSKIVAAPHGQKKTFVALAGEVRRSSSSPECASAFLCDPFIHHSHHHPAVIPTPHHDGHSLPPVTVPEHKPPAATVPVHKPSTPVYTPPTKPTPIYHPPAKRDAINDPQLFAKLFPFMKKNPFFFKFPFFPPAAQESKH
ncbi:hypothetical protein QOZ80_3BG0287310 [Eleusine coracana subsp. coracana]|nr:hypothetical protein QOZ80_3BG0287310 [Eleusine coracana subsp. coracana]